MSNAFIMKNPNVAICISVPKLLKCNWQEWPRNPLAMSLAANACSCNSSKIAYVEKNYFQVIELFCANFQRCYLSNIILCCLFMLCSRTKATQLLACSVDVADFANCLQRYVSFGRSRI